MLIWNIHVAKEKGSIENIHAYQFQWDYLTSQLQKTCYTLNLFTKDLLLGVSLSYTIGMAKRSYSWYYVSTICYFSPDYNFHSASSAWPVRHYHQNNLSCVFIEPLCCWRLTLPLHNDAKRWKPCWNPVMWYSSESTQWELSNEYQHDRV